MDGWVALAAAVVGFGLSEWSNRQAWRRQLDHRWDTDRLQRYAAYLAAVDELDDTVRTIASAEQDLEDPGVMAAEIFELSPDDPEEFETGVRVVAEVARQQRDDAQRLRREITRRVEQLESELEIMTTDFSYVVRLGLRLRAGDDDYRDRRKVYVRGVKEELQIPGRPPGARRRRWPWSRGSSSMPRRL